jgi:hypothetical protein
MNTTELLVSWSERKIKLRQKFASLTDNDLLFEASNSEEILEKLQFKLGKSKEELRRILSTL